MEQEEKQIKIIRLTSGEDIIAAVVENEFIYGEETHMTFVLVEPLKIVYTVKPETGMVSIGLIQWFFSKMTTCNSFEIHPKDVLTMADASKEMVEYYEKTNSFFQEKLTVDVDDFIPTEESPSLLNEMLNRFAKKKTDYEQ